MNIRRFAAVAAASLALVACGGGGDGTNDYLGGSSAGAAKEADSEFGQALTQAFMEDDTGTFETEEQAACVAGTMISEIGEERLIELGLGDGGLEQISSYGFNDEEFSTVVDAVFTCVDIIGTMKAQLTQQFTEEQATCITDKIDVDMLKGMALSELTGAASTSADEFNASMLKAVTDCGASLG
ncbi:MAG: hypothetical protein FGM45_06630 [Actinobacteria bacterium]|nr:hypothetical protein [Actinomycetota bacterium]